MNILDLIQLVCSVLFILSLRGLSSAATSENGNRYGIIGMSLIALYPLITHVIDPILLLTIASSCSIGYAIAKKINMTSLPQLIAAFHCLIGLAAVFIACAIFSNPTVFKIETLDGFLPNSNAIEMALGTAIGAITFTGSVVAFGKLSGLIRNTHVLKSQNAFNLVLSLITTFSVCYFVSNQTMASMAILIALSLALGYFLIMPIGGADMPVIVSMLNSYSGWAAAGIGFTLENNILIIVGALVGTSGAILSNIMCKGMNRSLLNVMFVRSGTSKLSTSESNTSDKNVKLCSPEDAGFIIKNSNSVIIVPGYGMAVAQAQHSIKELADILKSSDISIRYAIHPVAGRMPGHMNVLLAEANIPYEDVLELDEINHEFGATDTVIVIGANDITNPAAKNDPTSSIYGMPILDVEKAKTVLFIKRSLGAGYAGIDNSLFYQNNTFMILGDAKQVVESITKEMR